MAAPEINRETDWRSSEWRPGAGGGVEPRSLCAYNQTRECFLGLEVVERELQELSMRDLAAVLMLKSGEGIWTSPGTWIPAAASATPLDLIYLDSQGIVIEAADSFRPLREIGAGSQTASMLILPPRAISSSQTQLGDQLVVCEAGEMERRLEQFARESSAPVIQQAALVREAPLWSGGPGVVEMERRAATSTLQLLGPAHEIGVAQPSQRRYSAPKNWLERWCFPDPRRAPRDQNPKLSAYFWDGSAPASYRIRDISATGLYLVTEERWYPGTLVLMTLQRPDAGEEAVERSIYVQSRAVRWGDDGVGLQFVVADSNKPDIHVDPAASVADRKQLDRFLQKLAKNK